MENHHVLMGMAIFHCFLYVHQRVVLFQHVGEIHDVDLIILEWEFPEILHCPIAKNDGLLCPMGPGLKQPWSKLQTPMLRIVEVSYF